MQYTALRGDKERGDFFEKAVVDNLLAYIEKVNGRVIVETAGTVCELTGLMQRETSADFEKNVTELHTYNTNYIFRKVIIFTKLDKNIGQMRLVSKKLVLRKIISLSSVTLFRKQNSLG
ncbi:hypothetical protein A3A76_04525 [Candidatus Woesebacteria bacterium RIFCSPLOWO2_01_FULL_39_23]|uniref:Uncharacterized protein n=1 Tax=Candidatus Woesebacteria bacterium RIFCSPHIGHO2_01_FULL_40_22 TaxID=1802499 RepID=A0A1F7YKD2_9BACT|nr:MAG: hypothetical protein A2141_02135 [Candidatus Woesebacteria bacterium RBG_16_40_11]OGM27048.1 MAG: hypothetical protein A2628_02805 [Candidatus Woesebacteria bacterium RIFCSPHIGHO2_01_FULL_40_22]OGM36521.1 MAG: hypothetical protein A3E41_00690 [Candidatus Woesebacteria bacterium RIFCSPHIGHO2_12_FULL_38_9]OGM63283.1 MAG: hypothetical protein A3A76_04525 [Candidatus Woesebacteria bacterium RIFCSPLOWO2_01_FULL_39_23]